MWDTTDKSNYGASGKENGKNLIVESINENIEKWRVLKLKSLEFSSNMTEWRKDIWKVKCV